MTSQPSTDSQSNTVHSINHCWYIFWRWFRVFLSLELP